MVVCPPEAGEGPIPSAPSFFLPPLRRLFNESVSATRGWSGERAELMVLSQGGVDESLMHSGGTVDLAVFFYQGYMPLP